MEVVEAKEGFRGGGKKTKTQLRGDHRQHDPQDEGVQLQLLGSKDLRRQHGGIRSPKGQSERTREDHCQRQQYGLVPEPISGASNLPCPSHLPNADASTSSCTTNYNDKDYEEDNNDLLMEGF